MSIILPAWIYVIQIHSGETSSLAPHWSSLRSSSRIREVLTFSKTILSPYTNTLFGLFIFQNSQGDLMQNESYSSYLFASFCFLPIMDDFSRSNFLYRTCQCKSKNSYSSYTFPTNYGEPYPFFNIKTLFASFWLGVGVAKHVSGNTDSRLSLLSTFASKFTFCRSFNWRGKSSWVYAVRYL